MNGQRGNVESTLDYDRIKQIAANMRTLMAEMSDIFPERVALIHQLMFALLTRHHVLITGVYGTGKTDLLRTLFGRITGATMQGLSFNKFMTESAVIGVPDTKIMREEGVITYRREGSILDAHFLELDEMLDASTPLLRILLGIIHERRFKRGRQEEVAKLHTAVASTNVDIEEASKRDAQLGAVVDRFLFHCDIGYLKTAESRRRMYMKYLVGENPSASITLDDLEYISGIVVDSNQITDPFFIEVYESIIEEYCKAAGPISDRRKCKLLEIVEANALLNGRYEVVFEDILAIRWAICNGNDEDKRNRFETIAKAQIEVAKAKVGQNIDQAQNQLLDALENQIPTVPAKADDLTLVNLGRRLAEIRVEISKVLPTTDSTRTRQSKISAKVAALVEEVKQRIIPN